MRLEDIKSPQDIKGLSYAEMNDLAAQIRTELVTTISKRGGHLASNLGVVELTMAIHRVFNMPEDKIVFDVGHQSYVHKLLTGRYRTFCTLRSFGGMSGFPKRSESEYDVFETGHASTALSAALGLARARDLQGQHHHVLALVGDGAMTGGMCYEALNDAGDSHTRMIVILNDNEMSIAPNVGALSQHLTDLRVSSGWTSTKRVIRKGLSCLPVVGKPLQCFLSWAKKSVKSMFVRENQEGFFNSLGFHYFGPINGHDLKALEHTLEAVKQLDEPVVVHVLTKKGYGYSAAEDKPERFHGTPPFYVETGTARKKGTLPSYGQVMAETLSEMAKTDEKIVAITAAMPSGTGLSYFAERFPRRMMDVGIAEEHAVAMTAGMAKQGLRPVCALYSTFLQRAYDQLIHDVAIDHVPIVLGIDRAGIVGEDGATHNGVFDVGFLRQIPGMTLLAPSSYAELRGMLRSAVQHTDGPIALRYPRGGEGAYAEDHWQGQVAVCLREGTDVALVSYGIMINEALQAAELLEAHGVSAAVYKINILTAAFSDEFLRQVSQCGRVAVIEDVMHAGGVGQALAETLALQQIQMNWIRLFHTDSSFAPQGAVRQIYEYYHLDGNTVAKTCLEAIQHEKEETGRSSI